MFTIALIIYYKWQLRPDHLFSDKFYVTAEGYKTFDMFDDDIYLQDLINENQVSKTFMEFLNQEIDEAFHDYQENSDLSMRDRTEIVRSAIISKLTTSLRRDSRQGKGFGFG